MAVLAPKPRLHLRTLVIPHAAFALAGMTYVLAGISMGTHAVFDHFFIRVSTWHHVQGKKGVKGKKEKGARALAGDDEVPTDEGDDGPRPEGGGGAAGAGAGLGDNEDLFGSDDDTDDGDAAREKVRGCLFPGALFCSSCLLFAKGVRWMGACGCCCCTAVLCGGHVWVWGCEDQLWPGAGRV